MEPLKRKKQAFFVNIMRCHNYLFTRYFLIEFTVCSKNVKINTLSFSSQSFIHNTWSMTYC